MANAMVAAGVNYGTYASEYMWGNIMGSCTVGGDHALWYAHYDGNPSFSDFSPFGGWSSVSLVENMHAWACVHFGAMLLTLPRQHQLDSSTTLPLECTDVS